MYTITITKTEEVTRQKGNDWTLIDTRPYTKEELAKTSDSNHFEHKLKEIRGYTPEIDYTDEQETQIFKQSIEDLDMANVILAVNGMLNIGDK